MWSFKLLALVSLLGCGLAGGAQQRKGLRPHHFKAQYAGGIGYLSLGAGYANRRRSLEGDLFYGYVPPSKGGVRIHALTLKGTAYPVPSIRWRRWQIEPLSLGLLANYTFGKQYFGFSPPNYPYDYYKHPTAFNAAIFFGGAADFALRKGAVRRLGVYYEVLGFDRHLISYINNRSTLSLSDVATIGVGVRVGFREPVRKGKM